MHHLAHLAAVAVTASLLAGCAGAPVKTATPKGLVYQCDKGGEAVITYGGGGYLPGEEVRAFTKAGALAREKEGGFTTTPRSWAKLRFGGKDYTMLAEWTEAGLRFHSKEPYEGATHLIWTQRAEDPLRPDTWTRPDAPRGGEDVRLGKRPLIGDEKSPDGEELALCRRQGRDAPHAPAAHHGEEPHQADPGAASEPHL